MGISTKNTNIVMREDWKHFTVSNPLGELCAPAAPVAIDEGAAVHAIPHHRAAATLVIIKERRAENLITVDVQVLSVIADSPRIEIAAVAFRVKAIQIVHHDEENAVV